MNTLHDQAATITPPKSRRRLRILLSAYACQPDLPSEPGVGWNTALQMSQDHEIWVITNEEHRPYIMKNEAHARMKWIFVDPPKLFTFWRSGERGRRIHYYLWQIWAYRRVKSMLSGTSDTTFDVIHHITYVSYWTPSFLSLLPLPFLWGPVGGAESTPSAFRRDLSLSSELKETVRDAVRALAERFDIFVRKTARQAVIGLATTPESEKKLRQLGTTDVRLCSDIALPDNLLDRLTSLPIRQTPKPIRFISMGRLIGWKAYHLSIRAFALALQQKPDCEYWILGAGPEKAHLERIALEYGVSDKVRFWGVIPHADVPLRLAECDILLHPSLHDSGGWTCLEAMAAGRPVICLDLGGPATQITRETGIKVPATTPTETIAQLAEAMSRLAQDDELRLSMSAAGRANIQANYTWKARRELFNQLYDSVSRVMSE